MTFNYYYGSQADQFSFIRIPKILLVGERFKMLSIQSKMLYGVLLDRMSLSMKNGWFDKENRVYIIYKISDIQEDLGFSKKKSMDYLNELEKFGLVEKKRRGLGLPSILYVKSFMLEDDKKIPDRMKNDSENRERADIESEKLCSSTTDDCSSKSKENDEKECAKVKEEKDNVNRSVDLGTSRGAISEPQEVLIREPQEVRKSVPLISNTKKSKTKENKNLFFSHLSTEDIETIKARESEKPEEKRKDAESLSVKIKRNLDYEYLISSHKLDKSLIDEIIGLITETVLSKGDTMLISSNKYPMDLVKSRLLSLDSSHIEFVLECLKNNTSKVRNIKKYMLAVLFNAETTIDSYYMSEVRHDMCNAGDFIGTIG